MAIDEEQGAIQAGKRIGVNWTPWMGDWFVSHSPRNCNSHAEGPWDHWVDLALKILQDPMTKAVRPEAFAAVEGVAPYDFYDEWNATLSEAQLHERFPEEVTRD